MASKPPSTSSAVLTVFVPLLLLIGAIVGGIYVIERLFFTDQELARIDVLSGTGQASIMLAAGDELKFRLDLRAATQISETDFSDALDRARLVTTLTDASGATQVARCSAYNGWSQNRHSRERLRRPHYEGMHTDCVVRARAAGTHLVKVEVDWQGTALQYASLSVVR